MTWNSLSDFIAMGGYGFYVWGAYAVTAACLLVESVAGQLRFRRARRALATPPRRGVAP